jgi:hypothetical protein
MDRLRAAISILVDESLPIATRLTQVLEGNARVAYFGKSIATPILQVVYPDKYGVWNSRSEQSMRDLGLWPDCPRDASVGEQYERANEVIRKVAAELNVDLWTLDSLWWLVSVPESLPTVSTTSAPTAVSSPVFALERHLHEFLEENWEHTALAKEWALLEDEHGDLLGSHYRTGQVGEIDLLAKHRSAERWLVIELKRDDTTDATVGQLLRYMGWVRKNLAKDGKVEGAIICRDIDLQMQYAVGELKDVACYTYQVQFSLSPLDNRSLAASG